MASVEIRNIYKSFGPVEVIHGIDVEIADKELVVLVGPSGCGKSTLLRMIAGLEDITAGEIAIDDNVVNRVAAKDRNIAMVFQSYALYPHMTVYRNMSFGLRMRKIPRDEQDRRIKWAAETLELTDYLKRLSRVSFRRQPGGSASVSPWAALWCGSPSSSSSTSRSPTSTPSSACKCGRRFASCTSGCRPP